MGPCCFLIRCGSADLPAGCRRGQRKRWAGGGRRPARLPVHWPRPQPPQQAGPGAARWPPAGGRGPAQCGRGEAGEFMLQRERSSSRRGRGRKSFVAAAGAGGGRGGGGAAKAPSGSAAIFQHLPWPRKPQIKNITAISHPGKDVGRLERMQKRPTRTAKFIEQIR